ncbi:MAG: diguanylate cyclase [Gammaproteobacteria bacterium]|nr:diguanylate cyclase [Gammaproteobacteria bacterium]
MPDRSEDNFVLSKKVVASLGRLRSLAAWKRRVTALEETYGAETYRILLYVLVHIDFSPLRAKAHWKNLVDVWEDFDRKTGTKLDLAVIAVHYFMRVQKQLTNPAVVEIKFLQLTEASVIHDELTGVYNFRYFQNRIEQEINRVKRYDRGMSLLMIDVDDFKNFNDKNGHLEGNVALKKLAGILGKSVRDVDMVCRYGGEEFAVILPTTRKNGALTTAEKLRTRVERARFSGGANQPQGRVTISIGVATVPGDASNSEELIARADAALYRAKALGKNRVESFSDERREFERFDVAVDGRLVVLDKSPVQFKTFNVSQGGVLFRSHRKLPKGAIVQLQLRFPGEAKRWTGTARVVRVRKVDGGFEYGVEIIHVEGVDAFRLQSFIAKIRKKGNGARS